MSIESVVIKGPITEAVNKKITGLYLLERNIILLSRCGIKKIFLDFTPGDLELFNKKILRHIKSSETEIITDRKITPDKNSLVLKPEIFLQQHYLNYPDKYFKKEKGSYLPILSDELFEVKEKADIKKAEKLISEYIIKNTGGFIAQKINKRISIPISIKVSKTRIHPNYLTIINIIIGVLSSYFIFLAADKNYSPKTIYWYMVLGGFLFQAASVLDGVDGEVAKYTLKVSKIGGWLDTFGDNTTLLLFLISNSYLFYTVMGGTISLITILILFVSLSVMLSIMVNYLSKFSDSGSLVAYDREFLQTLPSDDKLVKFALSMKYLTKKEMFSIFFFLIGFTGHIYIIIPMAAFVLFAAAVILTRIHFKYIKDFVKGNS
ncbi:MAG TPA: CDP-alcohol phosphatidyltransferase family protein [Spirochaetota bacterium]|nr:CDP-alcohol phosphatidyltransferase family protein [Spirochaetota bacterium]HPS85113.1 CDP-alcohol phosphatidyltransferase family protein [Spirochaetota bacterium]